MKQTGVVERSFSGGFRGIQSHRHSRTAGAKQRDRLQAWYSTRSDRYFASCPWPFEPAGGRLIRDLAFIESSPCRDRCGEGLAGPFGICNETSATHRVNQATIVGIPL